MKRSNLLALFILVFTITGALFYTLFDACLVAHNQGEACLATAKPFITEVIKSFSRFRATTPDLYRDIFSWVIGSILLGLLVSLIRGNRKLAVLFLLLLFPTLAEGAVLLKHLAVGVGLHLAGVLFLCCMFFKSKEGLVEVPKKRTWHISEVLAYTLITAAFFLLRFYLLNRVPAAWDTEQCPDRHVFFRSFSDLMRHEAGWNPQTSLGFVWMLLNYLIGNLDEPDDYFLYLRFMSTGISALKFVVLFCCVRSLFGIFPAFLSIVLLGFAPPEDWWARGPNFHQLPGVIGILIVWASVRALGLRRYRDFVLLSILSGLTRWFYPSALFLVFVPVTCFTFLLILRWSEWKQHLLKISTLSGGLIFWLLWRSIGRWLEQGQWVLLAPLEVPSHSTLPGGLFDKLYVILVRNGLDIMTELLVRQVNPTHWTFALTIGPARVVSSIVIVLASIAVARILAGKSGAVGLLLLVSIGWAVFPGMVTVVADRRIGVVFVLLIILAVREAGYLTELMRNYGARTLSVLIRLLMPGMAMLYLGWVGIGMHFSMQEGLPYQVVRGQLLREAIEDDTLTVFLTGDNSCEAFYGVYRELKKRDCRTAWVEPNYDGPYSRDRIIESPSLYPSSWIYTMTDLSACLASYPESWKRVVFMMHGGQEGTDLVAKLKARYPSGVYEELERAEGIGTSYKILLYKVDFPMGTASVKMEPLVQR